MIHGFARTLAVRFDLDYLLIHDTRMNLLSARTLTLEPYEPSLPSLRGVPSSALEARPGMCLLGREEAAYSQSASPAFGCRWRLRDPRVACLRQVKKEESRWRGSPAARL